MKKITLASKIQQLTIFSLVLFGSFFQASGQSGIKLSDPEKRVIEAVSESISQQSGAVDHYLDNLGFFPQGMATQVWNSVSPKDKLIMAYQSAELAGEGNGEKFLAMLSKSLAQQYESAGKNPILARYLQLAKTTHSVKYSSQASRSWLPSEISPRDLKAIEMISEYFDAPVLGGLTGILSDCFDLDPSETSNILSSSSTPLEAIQKGYIAHKPKAGNCKSHILRVMISDLSKTYESLNKDSELAKVIRTLQQETEGPFIAKCLDFHLNGKE